MSKLCKAFKDLHVQCYFANVYVSDICSIRIENYTFKNLFYSYSNGVVAFSSCLCLNETTYWAHIIGNKQNRHILPLQNKYIANCPSFKLILLYNCFLMGIFCRVYCIFLPSILIAVYISTKYFAKWRLNCSRLQYSLK